MLTESFLEDCGGGVVRVSSGRSSTPLESTRGIPCLVFLSTSFIPTVTSLWITQPQSQKRESDRERERHVGQFTHAERRFQMLHLSQQQHKFGKSNCLRIRISTAMATEGHASNVQPAEANVGFVNSVVRGESDVYPWRLGLALVTLSHLRSRGSPLRTLAKTGIFGTVLAAMLVWQFRVAVTQVSAQAPAQVLHGLVHGSRSRSERVSQRPRLR